MASYSSGQRLAVLGWLEKCKGAAETIVASCVGRRPPCGFDFLPFGPLGALSFQLPPLRPPRRVVFVLVFVGACLCVLAFCWLRPTGVSIGPLDEGLYRARGREGLLYRPSSIGPPTRASRPSDRL